MSRFFKIDPGETEDDPTAKELDKKVEETLRMIAQLSSSVPEIVGVLAVSTLKITKDANGQPDWSNVTPENLQKFIDGLTEAAKQLPNISVVMGHWTSTLSAYATLRSLKKQETLTEKILASNNRLAWATVFLAGATVILAVFTAGSLAHLW